MKQLLRAIRNRLVSDQVLTSKVKTDDIVPSFTHRHASFPAISIGIIRSGQKLYVAGTNVSSLIIRVYSTNSKQECHEIYDRVRSLLNYQEIAIDDPSMKVHGIMEVRVSDDQYDGITQAFIVQAEYEVLWSSTGLTITTGARGKIYASKSEVRAVPSDNIAEFGGTLSLRVHFEPEVRRIRNRFAQEVLYREAEAFLTISEVVFKPSIIDLLWSVTKDEVGVLNDGITPATVYRISQDTFPIGLQTLYQAIKTDDGKRLEIEAHNAFCNALELPFNKNSFTVVDCQWMLLADPNGDVVRIAIED